MVLRNAMPPVMVAADPMPWTARAPTSSQNDAPTMKPTVATAATQQPATPPHHHRSRHTAKPSLRTAGACLSVPINITARPPCVRSTSMPNSGLTTIWTMGCAANNSLVGRITHVRVSLPPPYVLEQWCADTYPIWKVVWFSGGNSSGIRGMTTVFVREHTERCEHGQACGIPAKSAATHNVPAASNLPTKRQAPKGTQWYGSVAPPQAHAPPLPRAA